jgi:hypothetical protein
MADLAPHAALFPADLASPIAFSHRVNRRCVNEVV